VVIRYGVLLAAACLVLSGQAPDPAREPLEQAYKALETKAYDAAVGFFLAAVQQAPDRAAIRKDLGYTYLRMGETEAARDQFAEAVRLAPDDFQAALEYAFLCHETGKTALAHHVFDQVRNTGDPASRATAETAFQNIDRPLAEGIERWSEAIAANPDDFNAHRELAMLADRREELPLAAQHYLKAWRLRPDQRYLLVDLGRVWTAMGETEKAHSALLAASRGGEPRASEAARELLPERYPYVYEFRQAIDLDPDNVTLREELGYLLEAMGRAEEAHREFAAIPRPFRERPEGKDQRPAPEAKVLGDKSYRAGYLRDALGYYSAAHEQDPLDFQVILQLGWTYNVMRRDGQALRWFGLARKSPDPEVSKEARRAYESLRPTLARFRTTVWLFPTYSSRWGDVFGYGQVKTEWKLGRLPLRAYLSTRLIGDTRKVTGAGSAQYLSERSLIFGAGLATSYWHGLMLWAEAGSAARYHDIGGTLFRLTPDYRGGVAFYRGWGSLLGAGRAGIFTETNDDGVFVSRFQNDFVLSSQNRSGYTAAPVGALGGLQTQWFWNTNFSGDLRRQYWANAVELGPGLRFRWKWMPASWVFSLNALRGVYAVTDRNPWGRNYSDLRAGFWYAVTR
jgi:Tfp pilus assembly protein PilF